MKMTVVILLASMSASSFAGEIYQCGNSFQDRPCSGSDSKMIGTFTKEEQTSEEYKAKQEELKAIEEQTERDADARYQAEVEAATKARQAAYEHANGIKAVSDHAITMGLSREQVTKSWGEPSRKNETVTANGSVREQWVYPSPYGKPQFVYFTDGKVIGWN